MKAHVIKYVVNRNKTAVYKIKSIDGLCTLPPELICSQIKPEKTTKEEYVICILKETYYNYNFDKSELATSGKKIEVVIDTIIDNLDELDSIKSEICSLEIAILEEAELYSISEIASFKQSLKDHTALHKELSVDYPSSNYKSNLIELFSRK